MRAMRHQDPLEPPPLKPPPPPKPPNPPPPPPNPPPPPKPPPPQPPPRPPPIGKKIGRHPRRPRLSVDKTMTKRISRTNGGMPPLRRRVPRCGCATGSRKLESI